MALSTAIKTILASSTPLVAVVAARIYPCLGPEKPTLPCVVYTLTGLTPNESKTKANDFDECFVSVMVIANLFEDAETYGNYIRTVMNRYTGTIGNDKIISCNLTGQDWQPVQLTEGGVTTGVAVFAVNSTFKILATQNIAE